RMKTAKSACDWRGRRCFAEEATMRTIVLTLLALVGMSLTSTDADAGSWCANYRRGVSNCGYSSFEQCWATVRGILRAESIPRDGLRDGRRRLGRTHRAEERRAVLLEKC